ncbi:MAG: hypothetical protein ACD_15C00064G0001 [uncultured bacterium]|nr:MAG: hypothetical protein ACD_15C00064G0001 [uncultured bacterium]
MFSDIISEEILDKFAIPHIAFPQDTIQQKVALAQHILSLKGEELLLSSAYSFSYPSIIAGISEANIEYIGKNAPENYKTELLETIRKDYITKEAFEISEAMDKNLGENATKNQQRLNMIIQYIKDNQAVFQF